MWPHLILINSEAFKIVSMTLPHFIAFKARLNDQLEHTINYNNSNQPIINPNWAWGYNTLEWYWEFENTDKTALKFNLKSLNSDQQFSPKCRISQVILSNPNELKSVPEEPTGTILMSVHDPINVWPLNFEKYCIIHICSSSFRIRLNTTK